MARRGAAQALLLGAFVVGLAACEEPAQNDMSGRDHGPASVGVMEMQPQDVPLVDKLPGRTVAVLMAEVRPQVSGIVKERLFTEGAQVSQGQALYRIDPAPYEAELASAEAQLESARAAVPSAKATFERNQKLIARNAVSQQAVDDARSAYLQAQADVSAAQGALKTARINLDYTTVRAPIDGKIGASAITVGALATADQATALTTIRTLDPIKVDIVQSSSDMLRLRRAISEGQVKTTLGTVPIQLMLEDGAIYEHRGKLEFMEATINESTGTVTMRAEFPNPDRLLIPGMYVTGQVQVGVAEDRFLVPQLAVVHDQDSQAVAKVVDEQGQVEQRVLTVDRSIGKNWLVSGGLQPGDRLVIQGGSRVRDGQQVGTYQAKVDENKGTVERVGDSTQGDQAGQADGRPSAQHISE